MPKLQDFGKYRAGAVPSWGSSHPVEVWDLSASAFSSQDLV